MFEHEIGFVFYGKRLCGYMEHLFWVWSGQLSDLMSESEGRLFNVPWLKLKNKKNGE